jgi:cell division protein FtsW
VWLVGQATMNMGYVVGLLPVTGVQLPLISAGGTSLVLTLFIVGLLTRFALSEPAAIEAQRERQRSRLARLLLPVPAVAVAPIRPPRRHEERAGRRAGAGARRTLVHTRSASERGADERSAVRRAPVREAPVRGAPVREVPVRQTAARSGQSRSTQSRSAQSRSAAARSTQTSAPLRRGRPQ